jgi:PAS domain S-box-containing protein
MNDRRFDYTGEDRDAGYGDTWMEYVHPDDLPGIRQNFPTSIRTRQPFSSEYRLRRPDGIYRWVINVASPLFDNSGAFAGFIGSILDITDQKLAAESLARVSGQLIEAQDRERSRIARELHDDVCQRLAVLSTQLDYANRKPAEAPLLIEEIRQQCAAITEDVHALSHRLHSSKLEYLGLAAALRGFSEEFSRQHDVAVEFTAGSVSEHLPKEAALCLFRVAQEAVHNAMKYSQTSRFAIVLSGTEDEVRLEVSDCGVGFDVEQAKTSQGLGLLSMQERMNLVHGKFSIESRPSEGTRVVASVPVLADSEPVLDAVAETPAGMGNG